MKRAKIMLTAITVLAIVGGALAFKAKNFTTAYCYTTTNNLPVNGTCPIALAGQRVGAVNFYYYTTRLVGQVCDNATLCLPNAVSANLRVEQ